MEFGENIFLKKSVQEYLEKAGLAISDCLRTKRVVNLFITSWNWEFPVPRTTPYTRAFLAKLPPCDRTLFVSFDNLPRFVYPEALYQKVGVRASDEILYENTKEDIRESHKVRATESPLIYRHTFEYLSRPDDLSGYGEFLTVNLTRDQINETSQRAQQKIGS